VLNASVIDQNRTQWYEIIRRQNRKKKTIIFFKYQLVIIRNRCSIFKPVFVHLEILLPKNLMFMVSLIWKIYSLNRKSDRVVTINKRRTLCNCVQYPGEA
jgi:hypothetical protein